HETQDAILRALRRAPVELEILESAIVRAYPHGALTEPLLEVLLPEPRRLEHVPVGIDRAAVGEPQHLVSHAEGLLPRVMGRVPGRVKPASRFPRRHAESGDGHAVNPPSIIKLAPVTKPASGLTRYATIPAISSAEL